MDFDSARERFITLHYFLATLDQEAVFLKKNFYCYKLQMKAVGSPEGTANS